MLQDDVSPDELEEDELVPDDEPGSSAAKRNTGAVPSTIFCKRHVTDVHPLVMISGHLRWAAHFSASKDIGPLGTC